MLGNVFKRTISKTTTRAFSTNAEYTARHRKYLADTYLTWYPVMTKAEGVWMWDVEGNKYLDFHAGVCCVNQGHSHPRIVETLTKQAKKLVMCSRAFDTDVSAEFYEYLHELFGYEKHIPQSSGTEGCESAVKMARRWGYVVKGVPEDQAHVLTATGCFWGRSITACGLGACDDPLRYLGFGPYTPGFSTVQYNDPDALEEALKANPNIVAYMVEPIQGEAGVIVPDDGYLKKVADLCKKYNVLFIADEVQAGLGRAGHMLSHYHEEGVRPDIVVLAKAITGGFMPMTITMADGHIADTIKVGEHGSTYGGYSLAVAVAKTALEVIVEEELPQRSLENGAYFRENLKQVESPLIKEVRGRGLFNSLELNKPGLGKYFAEQLARNGLACKNTHDTTIRLAPPLTIERPELDMGVEILAKTLKEFE